MLLALLVLHRAKLLASNQSVLALGVAPMRVVSRWCRCVVQRLCATDCKHPCLVRAAAPHSAPAWMPGVYAQRLCTMLSQQSIHSPSPRGRGLGLGIENAHCFIKNRLSPKLKKPRFRKKNRGFLYPVYSLKLAVFILFIALLSLYSAISRAR